MQAMIDTGATTSLISQAALNRIPNTESKPSRAVATLGDGKTRILVNGIVELDIMVKNINTIIPLLVVEALGAEVILGLDWCTLNNVNVNVGQRQVEMNVRQSEMVSVPFLENGSIDACVATDVELLPHHEHMVKMQVPISNAMIVSFLSDYKKCSKLKIEVPDALVEIKDFTFYMLVSNCSKNVHRLTKNTKLGILTYQSQDDLTYKFNTFDESFTTSETKKVHMITLDQQNKHDSPPLDKVLEGLVNHIHDLQHRKDFLEILQRNRRSFDTSKMTKANTRIHHTINTGDHPPISTRPYYKTVQQRKTMHEEIEKLMDQGILRKSTSPWSSPALLKQKPDGSYRFLVDFRRLNAISKKDSYPQPSAEEMLHRLAGHKYFTKLDLRSGYFQIPIHESDIPKTAIITQDGLYEFTVLAQGLMNAPPTFQRVMNELLANGRWDYVVVYLDDILVFSKTIEEHKRHVDDVISTLHQVNFQVSPPKCFIAVETVEFLSHIVTGEMVKPSPEKIKAVVDMAPPKTLSQANKFIGKINYYRKFIHDFARIAAPIHQVTNKTRTKRNEFRWGDEQQRAFNEFKTILTTAPLFLDFPDRSVPFILSTDASDIRIAGILKQHTANGLKICYYKSRLLSDTERRYSATEREALAIYWCMSELRNYIGDSELIIETDHKPLANMHKKKTYGNKRIDSWLLKLQDLLPQINEIKYRRGIDNAGPDYLTRCEIDETNSDNTKLNAITRSMTRADEQTNISKPNPTIDTTNMARPVVKLNKSMNDLSVENIKVEQINDENIQLIISKIRAKKRTDNFIIHNGLLYRLVAKKKTGVKSRVLYLPKSLVNDMLELYHDHPMSGHFGVGRTLHKVRTKFWWPNMRQSIEQYISSCILCSQFNIVRSKPEGHLRSFEPPAEVFQVMHMDFWGPVPTSSQGNRYVIVLTDNLSKYVMARATPDNTAITTAEFIVNDFILVHGAPERIITDNGVHFNNKLMETIAQSMNINHAFSAVYHPATNGQVERFNATFCTQLAKYYNENTSDWDEYLQSIVYAYNTGIHSTTGYPPYELAFGRKQKSPFDSTSQDITFTKPNEFYEYLQKTRRILMNAARVAIRRQQNTTRQRYNKNRKDASYDLGDLVFLKVCTSRQKLDERWTGPWQVIDKKGEQHYLIQLDGEEKTTWAHINQLKPLVERAM
ncbi:unnamed protein product [Adineta ricciae]|uniref:RNA-directed DNA polymerase n=1 Tax=Adineta ricciae TaxID=249248 RepID=A0A815ZLR2_ADIRI|nr:unnamed protein product [Adineta ricciae]CAF1585116.1 unnamed protein product [Adineta ricciae]